MSYQRYGDNSFQANVGRPHLITIAQLLKSVPDMDHIDQLFRWLSYAMMHHFGVQLVQFWVAQVDSEGRFFMQLRVSSHVNSIPDYVALNESIAVLVANILNRRANLELDLISNIFSSHQRVFFERYGLLYCCANHLGSSRLLPSSSFDVSSAGIPIPMEAIALLFFSRFPPPPELQKSINHVLKLAVQLAETHGLLPSAADTPGKIAGNQSPRQQQSLLALRKLIPRRNEDADLMSSSNPLSGSAVISDKQARRLYAAIDGQKSVEELCAAMNLDLKEASRALQLLLARHLIHLYEPAGQLVDSSLFLDDRFSYEKGGLLA